MSSGAPVIASRSQYLARIPRVQDHIGTHPADPLDLQSLAAIAHFSRWHFDRVFRAVTRETVADCVRRLRLPNQAGASAFPDPAVERPAGPATPIEGTPVQVESKTLPAHGLAYPRHTGPHGGPAIGRTRERFGQWCAQRGLLPPQHDLFGIGQDNPEITPADKLRHDCCVPFEGTNADIHQVWMNRYGQWLPQSGRQAGDQPDMAWSTQASA